MLASLQAKFYGNACDFDKLTKYEYMYSLK